MAHIWRRITDMSRVEAYLYKKARENEQAVNSRTKTIMDIVYLVVLFFQSMIILNGNKITCSSAWI